MRSEDLINKRAEKLKKNIARLREREMRFSRIQNRQKEEKDLFISKFEGLCGEFKTDKPEEINDKFMEKTLEKQS